MTADAPTSESAPVRALIADDTPDIRMLLMLAFRAHGGIDVVGEAEDGEVAVRLASSLRPDVVVLDLAMPVMDGLQAIPGILEGAPDAKIVILSGFSRDKMEAQALQAGAHDYIEKGLSPKEIAKRIVELCRGPVTTASTTPAHTASEPLGDITEVERRPEAAAEPPSGDIDVLRNEVAAIVSGAPELASAFEAFCRALDPVVTFDRASFSVTEGDGFRVVAACGPAGARIPVGSVVPIAGSRIVRSLEAKKPFLVEETRDDAAQSTNEHLFDRGVRSYIAVPVVVADTVHAVIAVSSLRPHAFTQEDLPVLEAAVHETAVVFHVLAMLDREKDVAREVSAASDQRIEWNRVLRHDLRSPLTVIGGLVSLLEEGTNFGETQQTEFLEAIGRGVRNMSKLLDDMEQVDEIETGAPHAEGRPLDLTTIVEETVADVSAVAGRMCRIVLAPALPRVQGDEAHQRRILSNLLENAFKYTRGDVDVEVVVDEWDGAVRVAVRDYGDGIRSEDASKLFKKFSRLDPAEGRPNVRGSGLGLYICKSLVEAQGGRIWVESGARPGATFAYTVPVAAAGARHAQEAV